MRRNDLNGHRLAFRFAGWTALGEADRTRGTGYGIGDRFPEGNLGFGCRMEERSTRRAKREHDIAKPYYSPKVAAMKITIPKKSK